MRFEKSNRQKKRLFAFGKSIEVADRPSRGFMITVLIVGRVERLIRQPANLFAIRVSAAMLRDRLLLHRRIVVITQLRTPRRFGPSVCIVIDKVKDLGKVMGK